MAGGKNDDNYHGSVLTRDWVLRNGERGINIILQRESDRRKGARVDLSAALDDLVELGLVVMEEGGRGKDGGDTGSESTVYIRSVKSGEAASGVIRERWADLFDG